jgi:hypothetical protein
MLHVRLAGAVVGSLLVMASAFKASADTPTDSFVPRYHPTLQTHRAPGQIKIDGDLSDAGWQGTLPAANFTEHSPSEDIKPPVRTEAFVTYDDDHLYLSAVCYADPATVRSSICERERVFSDDNIGFFFDTYGDASRAYIINVNPAGIPYDALWTREWGEDQNFDLMFESAGKITDSGYQVELAIPFTSLRFPDKPVQEWKFDFYRHHQREVHYAMSWSAYDKKESCWPCQWGTVSGIENVKPGRGVELLPSFVAHQSGAVQDTARPRNSFSNSDIFGDLSIGGKYALSSDVVLEATYNPDFSQIEADASQVDVNTTFALSYAEKRPFFQEGFDLFRTEFFAVYSRSINSPDFAAKTSASVGRTSMAVLSAHDRQSLGIIPFEEKSEYIPLGPTFVNMVAVRRVFGRDNHIRALVTDQRIEGGGSGTIASFDAFLRLSKSLGVTGQYIATHTTEPNKPEMTPWLEGELFDNGKHTATFDGESFWGTGVLGTLRYDSRSTGAYLSAYQRTPTYRAANGFQPRNSDRRILAAYNHVFRPTGSIFYTLQPGIKACRIWNFDGLNKNDWWQLQWGSQFRFAQLSFWSSFMRSRERFNGIDFTKVWSLYTEVDARPTSAVQIGESISIGDQVAYDYEAMGRQISVSGWAEFRPMNRVLIEPSIEYTHSRDLDTHKEYFKGYIARTRLTYQFNREFSMRLVGEYNSFNKRWGVDPLVTYRLNSFSTFYAGATYDYALYPFYEPTARHATTCLSARQYFLKIQYLFQT